jgi:hypothetical protein
MLSFKHSESARRLGPGQFHHEPRLWPTSDRLAPRSTDQTLSSSLLRKIPVGGMRSIDSGERREWLSRRNAGRISDGRPAQRWYVDARARFTALWPAICAIQVASGGFSVSHKRGTSGVVWHLSAFSFDFLGFSRGHPRYKAAPFLSRYGAYRRWHAP